MSHRRNNAVVLIESSASAPADSAAFTGPKSLLPPLPSGAIMKAG
jgi:hypothetical protein